jgi:hypothetical protein
MCRGFCKETQKAAPNYSTVVLGVRVSMSCNHCKYIEAEYSGGFMAQTVYASAESACSKLVNENIWVITNNSTQFDQRFKCKGCGDIWRLVWPDVPMPGGLWFKTAKELRINELSKKLRNKESITSGKEW